MTTQPSNDAFATLLDQPPLQAAELAEVEAGMQWLLGTTGDAVVVLGEAILGLEAIVASIACPGRRVLNVVTGPYGHRYGEWFEERGAQVQQIRVSYDDVATLDEVAEAVRSFQPHVLAIVQAEAATGGTNPTTEILRIAREAGVITMVDAVSAVGAEPVLTDDWGADFVAVGPQKSVAGPAGISGVAVSERGWAFVEANPTAPRNSSLSLLDWRESWLGSDRSAVPGMPPWLEARAFLAAVARLRAEGLTQVHRRHRRAAAATLAGISALGLEPWQVRADARAPIVTTLRLPADRLNADTRLGGIVTHGDFELRGQLLRVNHYGRNADRGAVVNALSVLAEALGTDASAAIEAASRRWDDPAWDAPTCDAAGADAVTGDSAATDGAAANEAATNEADA